jgi:hypothetical protein
MSGIESGSYNRVVNFVWRGDKMFVNVGGMRQRDQGLLWASSQIKNARDQAGCNGKRISGRCRASIAATSNRVTGW